jgi:serine/threonine protein kinase
MEWCPGGSLATAAHRLDKPAKYRVMGQASLAAHALHEAGIAHRDIRPGNILLRADGSGALSDLGLAQLGTGSVTSMAPTASIGFMDPGQLTGDSAGRASDIYSLGATLHWVLTGKYLHPKLDPNDPMLAVRTVLRHPPHVDRESLTPGEADLIASCIDRNVAARPATAEELAALIDSLGGA